MLENERIIVQDRGFDAGLAALMQNANRGNLDPTAMLAMMNNGGFGGFGGNGFWWIFIIFLWHNTCCFNHCSLFRCHFRTSF